MVNKKKIAIVVGINEYPVCPLRYCINDAQEIAALLSLENFSFQVLFIKETDATRANIMKLIAASIADSPDQFIFYFAGHGVQSPIGTYLATYDYAEYSEGIELNELARLISSSSQRHIQTLLILDCCHSGAASLPQHLHPLEKHSIEAVANTFRSGHVILAACGSMQQTAESSTIENGWFTATIVEGLFGDAADQHRRITANGLYDFISEQYSSEEQTPVFKGDLTQSFILGEGFEPLVRQKGTLADFQKIEEQAQDLIGQFEQRTHVSVDEWKTSRYQDACSLLSG